MFDKVLTRSDMHWPKCVRVMSIHLSQSPDLSKRYVIKFSRKNTDRTHHNICFIRSAIVKEMSSLENPEDRTPYLSTTNATSPTRNKRFLSTTVTTIKIIVLYQTQSAK